MKDTGTDTPEEVKIIEEAIQSLQAQGWTVGITNNALIMQKHPPGAWNDQERGEWFHVTLPKLRKGAR